MTTYQSQYLAHLLSLRGSSGTIEGLSRSIANARVDLNPHQVDAALFALRSPLSRGVILADEVGLGKTIEAGIVLSQRWAERRRRILLIVPATLRKQWQQELAEKFFLPTLVLDARSYGQLRREGCENPFLQTSRIVVCSYQFAAGRAEEVRRVPWDLAVIDEAHRLRNVYRASNKTARAIKEALPDVPKLLLTATPLQNSLMELYGLVSLIDDHVFGDPASFREQFTRNIDDDQRNAELKARISPLCVRTLRKQVLEYVRFTRRVPITQEFLPSDAEHRLYESVSAFLQRDILLSLPSGQRSLITLVLRKLLASSSFAIAATLHKLVARLETLAKGVPLLDDDDLDGIDELEEELQDDDDAPAQQLQVDPALLKEELAELRRYAALADSIGENAKGEALLPALKEAFERAETLGGPRKAVVFTESRRTQQYLFDLLERHGYASQVVMVNAVNSDPHSQVIYAKWVERQKTQGLDGLTGSKPVDMKAAIVEEFRDNATILIATEAAAEGVNLQFCSLVVNFDLPWNPQRIEQRIGRCHRYGQRHDVVVVNFLNRRNEADLRVFEILSLKLQLFDGVFGASDEVLGVLESGVDLERRIAQVYQQCRTPEEITNAFDLLQRELDERIQARMASTRQLLLDNVDEEVTDRLRVHRDKTLTSLSERERWLWELTRAETEGVASFDTNAPRFHYTGSDGPHGAYGLDWKQAEASGDHFYRQDHPLATTFVERALARRLSPAVVCFDYDAYGAIVSDLQPLIGQSGWLELGRLTIESFEPEEFLLLTARTDDGTWLDPETVTRLMRLPTTILQESVPNVPDLLEGRQQLIEHHIHDVDASNARFFEDEVQKLDRWSDDLKQGLEREIQDIDRQIRETKKLAALTGTLAEKLEHQRAVKTLESARSQKRRHLFESQDDIERQRDGLIEQTERQLQQKRSFTPIYTVRWELA